MLKLRDGFKYQDANGDGVVNASDRVFFGSPNPDFTYGLNLKRPTGILTCQCFLLWFSRKRCNQLYKMVD